MTSGSPWVRRSPARQFRCRSTIPIAPASASSAAPAARADPLRLSVVIPTLNAEPHLAECLERMKAADEIIVVDGGSSDETVPAAERAGARIVMAPKGRGIQLAAGAEAARGDWLLFLHADTLPGRDWLAAVRRHVEAEPGKAA